MRVRVYADQARGAEAHADARRVQWFSGWAAINGSRGAVDTPELVRKRVMLDVEYIERQSFWLDMYIMFMTVPCLLGDSATVRQAPRTGQPARPKERIY